jgi:hypothetical protein
MDNLTICDRCGSDACYTQEVNNEIKLYHCYGCGFMANTAMKRDSEFFTQQMEVLPELYKELMGFGQLLKQNQCPKKKKLNLKLKEKITNIKWIWTP